MRVDVSRESDVAAFIEATERNHGPIDLFCSNAGIGIGRGLDTPNDVWQKIWEVNLMAHVYAARHLVPRMIARGGGYLLNTASAAGLLSQIGSATYAVTKHAAVSLAEWIAITHGHQGIKVSVLCPQAVRTDMIAGNEGDVASVNGIIEPEQRYTHPNRNQIFRSLGAGANLDNLGIDLFTQRLRPGMRLLLCSDGLWEMVHDDELARILRETPDPQAACDALVRAANEHGGEDNISALVVEISG